MKVGKRLEGVRVKLINAADKVSKVGDNYELIIKTNRPISDVESLIAYSKINKGLNDLFNAKVRYFENSGNRIIMDITGSPFEWFDLLVWIPEILMTVGVLVLAISVYIVSMYNKYLAMALVIGAIITGVGVYLRKEREKLFEGGEHGSS